jgi:hypothetical protein
LATCGTVVVPGLGVAVGVDLGFPVEMMKSVTVAFPPGWSAQNRKAMYLPGLMCSNVIVCRWPSAFMTPAPIGSCPSRTP